MNHCEPSLFSVAIGLATKIRSIAGCAVKPDISHDNVRAEASIKVPGCSHWYHWSFIPCSDYLAKKRLSLGRFDGRGGRVASSIETSAISSARLLLFSRGPMATTISSTSGRNASMRPARSAPRMSIKYPRMTVVSDPCVLPKSIR